MTMEPKVYTIDVGQRRFTFEHMDVNGDDFFQQDKGEAMRVRMPNGGDYHRYASSEYKRVIDRYGFPDFASVSLRQWHAVHRALFSDEATSPGQERYLTTLLS